MTSHTAHSNLTRDLQRKRGIQVSAKVPDRVSKTPKKDLTQRRTQAENDSLQLVPARRQQSKPESWFSISPSLAKYPLIPSSLVYPPRQAENIRIIGPLTADELYQSRELVPLKYFNQEDVKESSSDAPEANNAPSEHSFSDEQPTNEETMEEWRETLLQKLFNMKHSPSEQDIRSRVGFLDSHFCMTQDKINEARKHYERICYRQSPRGKHPFDIDGRPETYWLDIIKCFVNFDIHILMKWPEDYKPVCSKEELEKAGEHAQEDDVASEYTMASVTASTIA